MNNSDLNIDRLAAHVELFAATVGGVERLRGLILDLALRGRLGPQRMSETLPRWIPDSAALGSVPFDFPPSWACLRLDEAAALTIGKTPATKEHSYWSDDNSGIPWVSIGDMRHGEVVSTTGRSISPLAAKVVFRDRLVRAGTLLMSFKLTIGKIAILGCDAFHNEAIVSIIPRETEMSRFLFWMLPRLAPLGASNAAVMGATLNRESLGALPIPFAPLAEQKRIVAKVDQLMALCDELEARQTKKRETSSRLTKSALQALTTADGPEEFDVAWKRVVESFDVIVDRAEKVGEVRSAILELAVRGRLIEQRASDGAAPAFVMSDEAPFPLPTGWRWGRIETLASDIVDCLHATPRYVGSGYPAIRTADVVPGRMLLDQARLLDEAQYRERVRRLEPRAGDIFYSREGERLGIAACVPPGATVCLSQRMMHIRIREPLDPVYIMWVMNSRGVYAQAVGDTGGSTSPHVNMKDIRRFLVPVPPPAEQRRILVAIERFMKLCDDLEARLRRSEERAAKLVEAVVGELVA